MTTDSYTKDKRAATSWAAGIAAVILTGLLSFLGTQLMAHETKLAVMGSQQQRYEEDVKGMREDIKKILERLPKP